MGEHYRSRATYIWKNPLKYVKEESCYKFFIVFSCPVWTKRNKVALVYDESGNFIKTETEIIHTFTLETFEETKEDHIKYSLNYKERMENFIKSLIKTSKKEEITIDTSFKDGTNLTICFKWNNLLYKYIVNNDEPNKSTLTCRFQESDSSWAYIKVDEIPSLIGIESYIRNHPKIRVKYVNEFAERGKNGEFQRSCGK